MYSQFFGLQKNPFSQLIRQNSIYLPDDHQFVFDQLAECIGNAVGVVGLLGPAGVGKSTLIVHLVESFLQDKPDIFYRDLSTIKSIEEWPGTLQQDYSNIISAVREDFLHKVEGHRKSVFLLDVFDVIHEASLNKLLGVINDRNASNNPTLLILVGRSSLEQSLITAQHLVDKNLFRGIYQLDSLNAVEVADYINHRTQLVHYSGEPLFNEDAISAIAHISNGIPRHINTICGMSLFQAERERLSLITDKHIYKAAECCFLEDDIDSFLLQENSENSSVPDPLSSSAPRQDTTHFVGNRERWFSFNRLGVFAIVLTVAATISVQWVWGPQSIESQEKPVMEAQTEAWTSSAQLLEDNQHALNTHTVVREYRAAGVTFDAVDPENSRAYQDQSGVYHARNATDGVQDLLAQARTLEQRNRLTLPKDNNALATYRQVLDIAPDNNDAIRGIERIREQFIRRAKDAISKSHWKTAQTNLLKAKQTGPSSYTIDILLADVRLQLANAMKISENGSVDQQELAAKSRANARYRLNEKGIDFDLMNFFSFAEYGKTDLIALFLDANIPVDAQDAALGETALIKAAKYGHSDTVNLILKRHANINLQNRIGRTALMNAIVFEQYSVVYDLLNQDADINIRDQNGWNALMLAVEKSQPAIVEALLRKGANKQVRNALGKSALSIAEENGNNTIISLLQSNR